MENQVTICARCGQAIKNHFEFRGSVYGSECINVVTGARVSEWVVRGNKIDEEATAERNRKIEESRLKFEQSERERLAKREADTKIYSAMNAEVIAVLKNVNGGFASDMADFLSSNSLDALSERQYFIVKDIYAKSFGRYNSKAYWEAVDRINAIDAA